MFIRTSVNITNQSEQVNKSRGQLFEKSHQLSKLCTQKTWLTMLVMIIVSTIVR